MGVALPTALMFLMEHRSNPFHGSLLQIGRQDIYLDYATLEKCASSLKVPLRKLDKIVLKPNEWMPNVATIDDITFFKSLGFESVQSIDTSDYEKADFIWDFNHAIPDEMHNRFDVVFDGGSLEHVFDIGNAFFNIAKLLKVGGRAIHSAPTHNYVDHGFYCLSPTLFHDFYEANKFERVKCHLLGNRLPFSHNDIPKVYDYTPAMLEPYSVGGFTKENFDGCEMFATHCTATKTAGSTVNTVPMQRRYREWWEKAQQKKQSMGSDQPVNS